jgi:sodium-dependent dicarboxylate transporter 2/3/5
MKKVLGIAVFIILLLFILGLPISENIQKGLIVLDFAAVFWILEILPLPVTALSVPVLGVLLGVDSVKGALSSFAHPIIFLFFGGFALAAALQKYSIDKFIAWKIVSLSKGSLFLSSVFLFLATAFVSMWISNTSTTAMVLPLALGILGTAKGDWRLKHFVLLGIAYSASVGGIGTVVGSPPNGITAAELDMTFTDWLRFGLPTVAVLLPLLVAVLYAYFRPDFSSSLSIESFELKFGKKEKLVLLVFGITVLLWLLGKPISHAVGVKKYFDAVVAILAVVLLFVLNLVNWREIEEHTDWGTLLLFGGGITLSHFLKISGASKFIANSFVGFVSHFPPYLIVLSVVMFMIFMTELMSNTATAAIFVPILITAAQTLGMKPVELALPAGIAASCAFMLPVATPPNAIVYGTGEIKQKYMISAGLILNLLFSIAIALLILFIL